MLELYHYKFSVCSQKVRLCLEEKGLEWTGHHVDLMTFENTKPEYLTLNPNGVVPTLVHDGQAVIESTVINEYLEDVFPERSLRPADPLECAAMRCWIKLEDETALPNTVTLTMQKLIKPQMRNHSKAGLNAMVEAHPDKESAQLHRKIADEDIPSETLAGAETKLDDLIDRMENQLQKTRWLAGQSYSLADITWLPFVDRMQALGLSGFLDPAKRPAVADWWNRCRGRDSYQAAVRNFFKP